MVNKLTQVKINSTTLTRGTDYLDWRSEETQSNSVDKMLLTCMAELKTTVSGLREGMTVEIWEGYTTTTDTKVFSGTIVKMVEKEGIIVILAYEKLWECVKKTVNTYYDSTIHSSAGKISDIFIDLIETYTNLTADSTSVQDSGTVDTLPTFLCKDANVFERLQVLSAGLNWQFYYDAPTDKVVFEPRGFRSNPNTLRIGGNIPNVMGLPEWSTDIQELINVVKITGNVYLGREIETFAGDGSTTAFTLAKIPEHTEVDVDGTAKSIGKTDSTETGTFDYTVDKENLIVNMVTFPGIGETLTVKYYWGVPAPFRRRNQESIDLYGEGNLVLMENDVMTVNEANQRIKNVFSVYSTPFTVLGPVIIKPSFVVSLDTKLGDLMPMEDNNTGRTETLVVTKIVRKWPDPSLEIYLGDRPLRLNKLEADLSYRIRRIEEAVSGDQDSITEGVDIAHLLEAKRVSIKLTEHFGFDSWYLDNAINGPLTQTSLLIDGFNATGNWSVSGGGSALAASAVTAEFQRGTAGFKITWASEAEVTLSNTTDSDDLSSYTGAASGAPANGTAALWMKLEDVDDITGNVVLNMGSNASNTYGYIGKEYTSNTTFGSETATYKTGWNFLLFDLDNPDTTTGTPDWTGTDTKTITFTPNQASGTIYFDYLTIRDIDENSKTFIGRPNTVPTRTDVIDVTY